MAGAGRVAEKLQNRPAHAVLVDFLPPMDGEVVSVIQEALSQVLTLAYHLKGACRMSYFNVIALGAFPEVLFPIQLVRSNFNQLMTAVTELQSFTALAAHQHMAPPLAGSHTGGGVLVEGLQQAVEQFQRMAQNFRQDHCPLDMSTSDLCSSILDVCRVECEAVALSAVFKGWLHASTTDQEDVHIELPSSTGSGEHVVIKCDLSECMLDPAMLPLFEAHFSIHSSSSAFTGSTASSSKPSSSHQKVTQALTSDSVRHFKALSLVDKEGVCESVLFGLPMVLKPTSCWKLDWEDLESNTHNFAAMCKLLKERGQMLVVSESRSSAVPRLAKSAPSQQLPMGHFLVLPSPSPTSLLIKPIAVSELHLPSVASGSSEEPSCDTMVNVEGSLEKLPTQSLYNPVEVCSGLYSSFRMLQPTKKGGGGGRAAHSSAGTKRRPSMATQQSEAQRTAVAVSRTLGPKKSRLTVTADGSAGHHGNSSAAGRGQGRVNPLRYQPPPYLGDDFEM